MDLSALIGWTHSAPKLMKKKKRKMKVETNNMGHIDDDVDTHVDHVNDVDIDADPI